MPADGAEAEDEGFFSFLSFGADKEASYDMTIKVQRAVGKVQALISEHDESLTKPLRKKVIHRIKSELI